MRVTNIRLRKSSRNLHQKASFQLNISLTSYKWAKEKLSVMESFSFITSTISVL